MRSSNDQSDVLMYVRYQVIVHVSLAGSVYSLKAGPANSTNVRNEITFFTQYIILKKKTYYVIIRSTNKTGINHDKIVLKRKKTMLTNIITLTNVHQLDIYMFLLH